MNQFETDAIASQFYRNGYEIVDFNKKADVYVINTCTVTSQSDHKSRNAISQAIRNKEGALIVVAGCMANNHREDLEKEQHISYVVENDKKSGVFNLVDSHIKGEIVHAGSLKDDVFGYGLTKHGFHTRAMIKIQDGCDNFCSFCIVPKVRGRAVSRPSGEILQNISGAADAGFKEMVLTGVNIGRYRSDGLTFENLVEKILELPGDFRIRISSMEPDGFSERFFNLFSHPKLTPHLHLCLQSGSGKILLKMKRMYTVESFVAMTRILRNKYPDFNLTTDVIVGFPGETPEDFRETCGIVNDIGFSHIHTFKYSVRQGTKAARLDDQIPATVKNERSEIIRNMSLESRKAYFNRMLSKEQEVLIEKPKKGWSHGYGQHYIPIRLEEKMPVNSFAKVRLTGIIAGPEPEMQGVLV